MVLDPLDMILVTFATVLVVPFAFEILFLLRIVEVNSKFSLVHFDLFLGLL
jgi:hypothetical protein